MDRVVSKLTVLFEDPFWIGIFERIDGCKLSAAKVTFGAESKDYEILDFVNRHFYHLKFSPSVDVIVKQDAVNPKRRQREARKQSLVSGIGTNHSRHCSYNARKTNWNERLLAEK